MRLSNRKRGLFLVLYHICSLASSGVPTDIAESTPEPHQAEDNNTPPWLGVLADFAELIARKRALHGLRHEELKDKPDRSWPNAP